MGDYVGDEGLFTSGKIVLCWLLKVCDLPKDDGEPILLLLDESDKGSGLSTASSSSSMNCNDHQSKSDSQIRQAHRKSRGSPSRQN